MSSGGAKKTTGLPLAYDVDAEIVVEDEGHIVYLHTSWIDSEMMSGICFEATTESLYDMYLEFDKVADDVSMFVAQQNFANAAKACKEFFESAENALDTNKE